MVERTLQSRVRNHPSLATQLPLHRLRNPKAGYYSCPYTVLSIVIPRNKGEINPTILADDRQASLKVPWFLSSLHITSSPPILPRGEHSPSPVTYLIEMVAPLVSRVVNANKLIGICSCMSSCYFRQNVRWDDEMTPAVSDEANATVRHLGCACPVVHKHSHC